MRYIISILIISAGLTLMSQAQSGLCNNEENVHSTANLFNPKLFSASSNGFIVAWEDFRDSTVSYKAQQFDNKGNRLDSNFSIDSHYDISVTNDNSFFSLRGQTDSYYYPPYYEINIFSLYGRVYKNTLPVIDPFLLTSLELPWCGTGVLPLNHSLIYGAGYYVFAINWGMHLRKYDNDGNLVHIESERYREQHHISEVSIAITDRGDYMLAWFSADQWETTPGVYATFFDAQDSVVADSVCIYSYEGYDEWYWFDMNDPMVYAVSVADTAYQIFVIQKDTVNLRYRRFDIAGNPVGDTYSIDLPIPEIETTSDYTSIEAQFSRGADDKILLVVTTSRSHYNDAFYSTSIITFDRDGTFTDDIITIDERIPYFQRGAHQIGENSFLVVGTYDNDIYLYTLTDFIVVDSLKINDLISGGIQIDMMDTSIPESYILFQNYPNPFNPETYIRYSIPKAGNVTLSVYNMLGKEIKTLINQYQQAGTYRIPFDASNLSSGVYIYRISADSFTDSKRMILVR